MPTTRWHRLRTQGLRLAALLLIAAAALQAYFAARVALMAVVDPASTAFQRSEAWRLLSTHGRLRWSQTWVDDARIADALKRAVIASEDARFVEHDGVDWDAIEQAWERNLRAQERAEQRPGARPLRLVGGSTITQQLAKNLFLSGERTVLRKAQEFVVTQWLELLLPKRRILEIYLNHVEWGEGVFGAQAAARHYFRTDAARLGVTQAARLAVMLPAPKRFERRPDSAFLQGRAATIAARMGDVELP
jgi:monofunctional biosynthetic peptidoglycan transglycosylase